MAQSPDPMVESSALSRITWFAILQLGAIAGGFVAYLIYLPVFFSSIWTFTPRTQPPAAAVSSFLRNFFGYVTVVALVAIAVELVALYFLWDALNKFSRIDRMHFSTPATLTLVLILGMGLAAVGIIPLFSNLSTLISQVQPNSTSFPFTAGQFGIILGLLALLGVGGILALVGLIGGQILGLWRVGTRYDSTLIKVGSIFVVVPLLNVVGPVLVLVGTQETKHRLSG